MSSESSEHEVFTGPEKTLFFLSPVTFFESHGPRKSFAFLK